MGWEAMRYSSVRMPDQGIEKARPVAWPYLSRRRLRESYANVEELTFNDLLCAGW